MSAAGFTRFIRPRNFTAEKRHENGVLWFKNDQDLIDVFNDVDDRCAAVTRTLSMPE